MMVRRELTGRRFRAPALVLVAALALSACMVESPTVETTAPATALATAPTSTTVPTAVPPSFEPTVPPAEPTAEAPTPVPTATPAPDPALIPIPAEIPSAFSAPEIREPGLLTVPVAGATTFRLASPRPLLQLPGHSLIYLDPDLEAEVDVFTPVSTGLGEPLNTYDAVVAELLANPAFASLEELPEVSIAGFPTRVFEGRPITGERGFFADTGTLSNPNAGWFPPARLRLWLIDTPNGPVAVTAESLFDPGQYDGAVALAASILSTITFDV